MDIWSIIVIILLIFVIILLFRRPTMQGTFTLTFNIAPAASPLAITNSTFSGTVGVPITGTLGITGGLPPYTVAGDLSGVPGVTLDPTGTVAGTPTTPGTTNVSVTITDSGA